MPTPSPPDPEQAARRAIRLERLTVGWNAIEVVVTVALGVAAGSLALVAFGLDSLVEIFASFVVLWQLRGDGGERTRRAMFLVAIAFFSLAVVLTVGAVRSFAVRSVPDDSPFGIAYLALTALVMFTLAWRKRILGDALANHPLETEARMTLLDGFLAVGVLLALVATAVFGAWWADPLAALGVAAVGAREGVDAWGDSRPASVQAVPR